MNVAVHRPRAASLGPLAHAAAVGDAPWRGVVREVGASSCRLEASRGHDVVVHATAHGHSPTSVLVDDVAPSAWGLRPGDRATWRLGRLHLGTAVVIDTAHAPCWSPPAPPSAPVAPAVAHNARLLLASLDAAACARIGRPCTRLAHALRTGRPEGVVGAARALVGNGPGSTPSGDDALVAMLAVLDRGHVRDSHAMLAAAVAPMLERTTPLGAHYLRLACDRHVGERLLQLVDAALADPLAPADPLVVAVRTTGATSGEDALVGAAAGLALVATSVAHVRPAGRCAA